MRFVRYSRPLLSEGVERHHIEGVPVAVFDAAKSIVDCFRYRNKLGLDLALEGLREGFTRRRVTVDQLTRYASHARDWTICAPMSRRDSGWRVICEISAPRCARACLTAHVGRAQIFKIF